MGRDARPGAAQELRRHPRLSGAAQGALASAGAIQDQRQQVNGCPPHPQQPNRILLTGG